LTVNALTLTLGGQIEVLLRTSAEETLFAIVTARYSGFTVRAKGDRMAYTLAADKMVSVRVDYVDAQNNPATVDGPVTWDTSAPDVVSVVADQSDSQVCSITAGTQLGTAQVTARADADLGQGTRELITTLDVTIVAGEAIAGVISPTGDPQPKP
jgi:hypothetical protein